MYHDLSKSALISNEYDSLLLSSALVVAHPVVWLPEWLHKPYILLAKAVLQLGLPIIWLVAWYNIRKHLERQRLLSE
jgi:hypothetical protein